MARPSALLAATLCTVLLAAGGVSAQDQCWALQKCISCMQNCMDNACQSNCMQDCMDNACQEAPPIPGDCSAGFTKCGARCYQLVDRQVNYAEAEQLCEQRSSHLAVPRTDEENTCVNGIAPWQGVWLGITDRDQEDEFRAYDGSEPNYTKWMRPQPDNFGGNEDCVEMGGITRNVWNDRDCSSRMFVVCEE